MNLKKYIGDKTFYKSVLSLIVPIMLQQLLVSVASYIDNLMINGYTENSLAYNGVSAANRLIFVLNFIWLAFATVASIFIAQFYGSNNKKKNEESFRLGFYFCGVVGILSTLVVHFFGNIVVDSYVLNEASRQFGYEYLNMFKYGCLITTLSIFFANSLRTIKLANIALVSATLGIIVNIVLNYSLIYGHFSLPEMGASGAALATVISRLVELLFLCYFIFIRKNSYFRNSFSNLFVSKKLFVDFVKKGFPIVLNEIFWSLGMVLLVKFYTYENDVWYSAYSYSQNISDLFFILFAGLGSVTAILIGADLGSNDFDKALDNLNKLKGLSIILGVVFGLLMIAMCPLIVKLFNPTDEVRKLTVYLVILTGVFLTIYSYNSVCFFTMRAGGDSVRAFILDEVPTYLIALPICIFLGVNAKKYDLSLIFIYLTVHISDIFKIWLSNHFIAKRKWLVNLTLKHTQ